MEILVPEEFTVDVLLPGAAAEDTILDNNPVCTLEAGLELLTVAKLNDKGLEVTLAVVETEFTNDDVVELDVGKVNPAAEDTANDGATVVCNVTPEIIK